MTLCIGIEKKGKVFIGADSGISTSNNGWCDSAHEPKVWNSNGWILTSAGGWRESSLIMLAARLPKPPNNPEEAYKLIYLNIINEFHRVYDAHGYKIPENEKGELEYESEWLIGAKGAGLYYIDPAFHVSKVNEWSIGNWDYAQGWLDGSAITDPELRIKECIKSASKRYPGSIKLPVTILSSE